MIATKGFHVTPAVSTTYTMGAPINEKQKT